MIMVLWYLKDDQSSQLTIKCIEKGSLSCRSFKGFTSSQIPVVERQVPGSKQGGGRELLSADNLHLFRYTTKMSLNKYGMYQ